MKGLKMLKQKENAWSFLYWATAAVVLTATTAGLATPGYAQSGDGDAAGAKYKLSDDGKVLEEYLGSGETFIVPEGVEEIPNDAFVHGALLTRITLPKSVNVVRPGAFDDCASLTSIDVSTDNPDYRAVDGVLFAKDQKTLLKYPKGRKNERYVVPKGVERIGNEAFEDSSSLASIELPEGLVQIGAYAFYDCSSLTSVAIPTSVAEIEEAAFEGCRALRSVDLPPSLEIIPDSLFEKCSSMTSIVVPKNVASIGNYAFSGCSALKSVVVPEGVSSIARASFENCSSLTSVALPKSVASFGRDAFRGCSALESIVIPEGVVKIGDNSFTACGSLRSIAVAKDNSQFSSKDGVLFSKDGKTLLQCPEGMNNEKIAVPASVEKIGVFAFANCSQIKSIIVPNSVKELGNGAFLNCSALTSIDVPEGVAEIGTSTFEGCSSLTTVSIPQSVQNISTYAFDKNDVLTIRAPKGSYAEKYAKENGIKFEALE